MNKIIRSARNMKVSGRSGSKKPTTPLLGKIKQPKKDIVKQVVRGKSPGSGLDDYSLDIMTLE